MSQDRVLLGAIKTQQRRVGQTEVGEKAMTLLPLNPHDGLISPFAANGNPFLAPIWRDCTPARLAMSVYCAANDGANFWTITLYISGAFGVAQGSVDTSALAAAQWQPLALTTGAHVYLHGMFVRTGTELLFWHEDAVGGIRLHRRDGLSIGKLALTIEKDALDGAGGALARRSTGGWGRELHKVDGWT